MERKGGDKEHKNQERVERKACTGNREENPAGFADVTQDLLL